MRVGVAGLLHESNTFITRSTTRADFENDLLLFDQAMTARLPEMHHELGGFCEGLAQQQLEMVPLLATRAVPFGPIAADTFAELSQMLFDRLEAAGPLDGLLMAVHGAAVSRSYPDADGWLLAELRGRLGADRPLIATLDPHANVSPQMVAACDALIAYRTNPHLDQRERGLEAARLMARTLRGEVRPQLAACLPPLAINIERQCTSEAHWEPILAELERVRADQQVLSASVLLGFPYADVAEMGAGVLVVADGSQQLARQRASELGQILWQHRESFLGQMLPIDAALVEAQKLPGPVCLLDMGDNVGGGSPADGTWLAHAMEQRGIDGVVVLYDPEAVEQARAAGVGQQIDGQLGGKTDALHGPPLGGRFTVEGLYDGRFEETEARHGGLRHCDQGASAVVRSAGGVTVLLTSRRMPPFSLRQLTSCGIEPHRYQVLTAKGVNAPLAAYREVCRHFLRVDTPGVTSANLQRLAFHHRRRPLYPFELDADFHC